MTGSAQLVLLSRSKGQIIRQQPWEIKTITAREEQASRSNSLLSSPLQTQLNR